MNVILIIIGAVAAVAAAIYFVPALRKFIPGKYGVDPDTRPDGGPGWSEPAPTTAGSSPSAPSAPKPFAIDYARYRDDDEFVIRTRRFPNGLPPEWDWDEYYRVTGRAKPAQAPTGPGADLSGYDLEMDGGQRINVHPAGEARGYNFTGDGRHELAWAANASGGWVESWISRRGEDAPLPGSYQRQINGNAAGETYFTTGAGQFTYWLKSDRAIEFKVQAKRAPEARS